MAKRSSDLDPITSDSDGKRRKLEEKEHLSFLVRAADLKKKIEEAKMEAEFYRRKCENKEKELEECRQRGEELLVVLKSAQKNEEKYQQNARDSDLKLQRWMDEDMPRIRAPATVEDGSQIREELVCCSETGFPTGFPTAVCRCCGDEEATVVLLPCNHLCVCLECESEIDRCPYCNSPKTGWFWADALD